MAINMTSPTMLSETYHEPVRALRWGAIAAGLAVGIATNLFLVLLGAAAGLAMFGTGNEPGGNEIPIAVAIWNTVSMIAAAFAGGYVAARSAGMRRNSDGILHGVVAWGATLLISVFFLSSIAGATLGSMFGMNTAAVERMTSSEIVGNIDQGNRQEAINMMRDRLGLTGEQASRMVDQALVLSGQANRAAPQNREATRDTLRTASVASGWLSGAIFLSLFAAIGGGLLGARGSRRVVRTPRPATVVHTKRTETPVV